MGWRKQGEKTSDRSLGPEEALRILEFATQRRPDSAPRAEEGRILRARETARQTASPLEKAIPFGSQTPRRFPEEEPPTAQDGWWQKTLRALKTLLLFSIILGVSLLLWGYVFQGCGPCKRDPRSPHSPLPIHHPSSRDPPRILTPGGPGFPASCPSLGGSPHRFLFRSSELFPTAPCKTSVCQDLLALYLASGNTSVAPCTDFFSFACGNADRTGSPFQALEEENKRRVRRILETPGSWRLAPGEEKAFGFYNSCMNTGAIEAAGAGPLRQVIEELGGWPTSGNWTPSDFNQTLSLLMSQYGHFPFFRAYLQRLPTPPYLPVIQIDQPEFDVLLKQKQESNYAQGLAAKPHDLRAGEDTFSSPGQSVPRGTQIAEPEIGGTDRTPTHGTKSGSTMAQTMGPSVELTKPAKGKCRQKGSGNNSRSRRGRRDRQSHIIKLKAHVLAAVLGAALHPLQLSAEKQSQN
ncbi:hypothetical protein Celaphus_00012353 [Cervus elaphus hippelaphus]|uniref:Peptidase M13 N-terminal domain-containing protein n=1 Tax=Cervus elaphus hippelaphus TaxID=46360 RepID=A0A212CKB5_CEREH|nr:hypothetical protein Celaphus_00012353 [Cervus elaphus hippelaphus]